jgi:dipeptidyl aminopeptidase/acylaminoacyl peptidase
MVSTMKRRGFVAIALLTALALPWPAQAQKYDKDNLPRLPGAELLVEGYLPERLLLTTESKTLLLQEDTISLTGVPSISVDGGVVASARRIPGDPSRDPRLIASTYSVKDNEWTEHPELEGVWGPVAISPDGSKLACVTRDRETYSLPPSRTRLQILDLKTGKVSVATRPSEHPGPGGISWSPDGRRIAFEMQTSGQPVSEIYAIDILDVETGGISQIGLGQSPSWSPSGDWIAYANYVKIDPPFCRQWVWNPYSHNGRCYSDTEHQFSLMSPIGTHNRVLMGFGSDVSDNAEPVWSPDSKTLLLTRVRDPDNGTFNIYTFDLVKHKLKKKFKNVGPVYGWVDAK